MSDLEPSGRPRLSTTGDYCIALGTDVRDLLIAGYTWEQIDEVARGSKTLEQMLSEGPAGKESKRRRPGGRPKHSYRPSTVHSACKGVANWIVRQIAAGVEIVRVLFDEYKRDDPYQ